MSGKYSKSKKYAGKNRKTSGKNPSRKGAMSLQRRNLIVAVAVVALALVAAIIYLISLRAGQTSDIPDTSDSSVISSETTNETLVPDIKIDTGNEIDFNVGEDIAINKVLKYTGAYMEDGSDDIVSDVLAIQITNNGSKYIQPMDIILTDGETEAYFSLSTLMPGDTMIVLEKNRMKFSTAPEFTDFTTQNVAFFDEIPGMCEDLVEIQALDGVINVTNISGADIEGNIVIYYKNYINGIYYGGMTYRSVISGGLEAGEIRQGAVSHYNPANSVIVFVTCG